MANSEKVLVGKISGAHGVKGLVKITSFTVNPSDLFAYGKLYDETLTRTFSFKLLSTNKNVLLCQMEGITDRTAADKLKGLKLYALREGLPKITADNTYYHADLIGLTATDGKGTTYGKISSIFNFGAGDILDITDQNGKSVMIPFTKKDVPVVDITGGFITVTSPDWFKDSEPKTAKQGKESAHV